MTMRRAGRMDGMNRSFREGDCNSEGRRGRKGRKGRKGRRGRKGAHQARQPIIRLNRSMSLSAGTRLGPYEIVEPLGAGGMGEVYRARDPRLRRDVAIKVLPPHLSKDPEALARFEREAHAVAALSHPNILAIFDVGNDRGLAYVVTELLEGETLRGRLRAGAIPWPDAMEIGAAIADALSTAHAKGIIHRDLKPENVFLTADGRAKVLDFGLARHAIVPTDQDETAAATQPGVVLGTVGYMSPEQ